MDYREIQKVRFRRMRGFYTFREICMFNKAVRDDDDNTLGNLCKCCLDENTNKMIECPACELLRLKRKYHQEFLENKKLDEDDIKYL